MTIVENHEIQYFGHKFQKTENLHQAIFARKFTWRRFPVTSEFNDEHLTYIARDSPHYCLPFRKRVLEIVYIDACFVLPRKYSLT